MNGSLPSMRQDLCHLNIEQRWKKYFNISSYKFSTTRLSILMVAVARYRQLLKQMERMEASFDVVSHKVDTMKYGEATEDEETYAGHENWELGQGRPSGRLGPQISYSGTRNQSISKWYSAYSNGTNIKHKYREISSLHYICFCCQNV